VQFAAICCNSPQFTAIHRNSPQFTAKRRNSPQNAAIRCKMTQNATKTPQKRRKMKVPHMILNPNGYQLASHDLVVIS